MSLCLDIDTWKTARTISKHSGSHKIFVIHKNLPWWSYYTVTHIYLSDDFGYLFNPAELCSFLEILCNWCTGLLKMRNAYWREVKYRKKYLEESLDLAKHVPKNIETIKSYLHEVFLTPRFLSLCINLSWLELKN